MSRTGANNTISRTIINAYEMTDLSTSLRERESQLQSMIDSGDYDGTTLQKLKNELFELQQFRSELSPMTTKVEANEMRVDMVDLDTWLASIFDVEVAGTSGPTHTGDGGDATGTEHTGSTGGASGGGYVEGRLTEEWMSEHAADGDALLDAFNDDPKAFAAAYRELSDEDRQLVMQALQSANALNNQIMQMLTNILKSQHDTLSALARNMSV